MERKVKVAWLVCFYVTLELRKNEKEFPRKTLTQNYFLEHKSTRLMDYDTFFIIFF